MKTIFLILSFLIIPGCPSISNYPASRPLYTTDIGNMTCIKRVITNIREVTTVRVEEFPLVAGGPCDHMIGYSFFDFKFIQNWVRDNF